MQFSPAFSFAVFRRFLPLLHGGCSASLWLALLLAIPGPAAAQSVPWILPWNDATPAVTDFSAFNPPIGTNWVAVDANGHFVVNGARIRFLGVNFAGDSPFMPTNNAEGVAARLAKFGVNNVRFHHMDAPWAYNAECWPTPVRAAPISTPPNSNGFTSSSRDLKAHGIYSDINCWSAASSAPWTASAPRSLPWIGRPAHPGVFLRARPRPAKGLCHQAPRHHQPFQRPAPGARPRGGLR